MVLPESTATVADITGGTRIGSGDGHQNKNPIKHSRRSSNGNIWQHSDDSFTMLFSPTNSDNKIDDICTTQIRRTGLTGLTNIGGEGGRARKSRFFSKAEVYARMKFRFHQNIEDGQFEDS
ncbi:uncharacterized protein LOC107850470 isoform X2 [Capsicum annuum]|uniref:uncharacterized protein LOC107850470 isoform X2 n=1 Tax=Capsicum annuum TaxID=4072 RepID=UPI001FB148C7|nr:uncharacterized protein LOC107850470 isoform X2 [Capsicum annuum]